MAQHGTFLELGLYWADLPEEEAFARLLAALEARGVFIGTRAMLAPAQPFGMLSDQEREEVEWRPALLDAPDGRRVVEVQIGDPLGGRRRPRAMVRYVGISDAAAAEDHHPIAVMNAAAGAEPSDRRYAALFRDLVTATAPSYGAITVEHGLACPADLRRDPRAHAFSDFFVSRAFTGPQRFEQIRRLVAGARVEEVGDGAFFRGAASSAAVATLIAGRR